MIDDTLEEVRGIVDTPDGLYANANVSKGLFRLRDTNGAVCPEQVSDRSPSGTMVSSGGFRLA